MDKSVTLTVHVCSHDVKEHNYSHSLIGYSFTVLFWKQSLFKLVFGVWGMEVPLYWSCGALPPMDFLHWNSIKCNWITMGENTRCQLLALRLRKTHLIHIKYWALLCRTSEYLFALLNSKITTVLKCCLILGSEEKLTIFLF